MDLRQLTTFRTVATTLSFTRAAAALNYVQSSVTAQVQALEEELGVQLFDRLGKRVTLTDAGQSLLTYADRILNLADEAKLAVSQQGMAAGSITLTAPETLCTYRLPAVLREFRLRYPQVQLIFKPCGVAEIRRCVAEGMIDVAFLLQEPMQSSSLLVEVLRIEPLVVIAPPDHRLVSQAVVDPADLAGEPILFTELGCNYRNMFERQLIVAGVYPKTNFEFNSIEAIKQCVMNGIGIAVLPEVTAINEIAQGRLAPLRWSAPDFHVSMQMLWHKDKWMSPAISAFLNLSREVLCEMRAFG